MGSKPGAVNVPTSMNAYFNAVRSNELAAVTEYLRHNRENVDSALHGGMAALHQAAACGHTDMARLLVRYGADVNLTDQHQFTPLMYAALHGHLETVQYLDAAGGTLLPVVIGAPFSLSAAAREGHTHIMSWLVLRGVDVDTPGLYGQTTLTACAIRGKKAAVACLLEHGANPDLSDRRGYTAADHARFNGHPALAEYIKSGFLEERKRACRRARGAACSP